MRFVREMVDKVLTRFDEYQQYDTHRMDWNDLFKAIGEWREYADPAEHRLEFELNRAMLALPMLADLQVLYDQGAIKALGGYFKALWFKVAPGAEGKYFPHHFQNGKHLFRTYQ